MYAHDLRKWSLAKFLMFKWLPVLMLLVFWCPGAVNLHLASYSSSLKSNDNFNRLSNSPDSISTNENFFNNNPFSNYSGASNIIRPLSHFEEYFGLENINSRNDSSDMPLIMGSRKIAKGSEQTDPNLMINQIRRSHDGKTTQIIKTNDNNNINNNKMAPIKLPQTLWAMRLKEKRMRNAALRYRLKLLSDSAFNDTPTKIVQSHQITSAKLNVPNEKTVQRYSNHPIKFIQSGRNRRESRHENRQQLQQQSGRVKPRRFCSARDPTTLAFEAPTVFEGKVRSMSSDRRRNFSVTFEVKEVYKRQLGHKLPLLVRLQFSYRNSSECDIYKETLKPRGYVREELEQGKLYILFVEQIDIGNYTILGQPIKKTKKVVNEIRVGVSEKYDHNWHNSTSVIPVAGQRASIESLLANYSSAREGRRIRIVCRVRGQPPPKVTWFKDGRSISRNRIKYQFIHLRKRAELIIKSATRNDSGQYECRAKNKLARQPVSRSTRIEILPREYEVTTLPNNWTHSGSSCPVIGEFFCLNGGTCVFFKDVGEPACKCPDGFLGNRCETKNPTNLQPSTYNKKDQQQCGDNKYYGSYYC